MVVSNFYRIIFELKFNFPLLNQKSTFLEILRKMDVFELIDYEISSHVLFSFAFDINLGILLLEV